MTGHSTKIAYIVTPITFGGAERVSLNFLSAVNREQFDVRPVLLIRPWEDEPFFAGELRALGYSYETIPVALRRSGDWLRVPRVCRKIHAILKQWKPDLVHTHGYFADVCGLPVARMLGIPRLSTCHGFISNDRKLRFYNRLDKLVLRLSNRIIAVSGDVRDELVRFGLQTENVEVIPNSVDAFRGESVLHDTRQDKRRLLQFSARDFVVGYTGRLSREKGISYLIEAIALLHRNGAPVKLLLLGDGPEKESLECQVRQLGLESEVVFAGFQSDISSWLPASDVQVLPSLTEGTPMSLLEAMSMHVPIIASAVGGVPDLLASGECGVLVAPKDAEAISQGIAMLREQPDQASKLVKNALKKVRNEYDIYSWCRKVENSYNRTVPYRVKEVLEDNPCL